MSVLEICLICLTILFFIVAIVFIVLYCTKNVNSLQSKNVNENNNNKSFIVDKNEINVVWFQPIFIPIDYYYEFAINVLEGFKNYAIMIKESQERSKHGNVRIDIYFKGYVFKDEIWNNYLSKWLEVQKLLENCCINFVTIERLTHNYGQAYVYQTLFESLKNQDKYKYVITNGSDLYIPKDSISIIHQCVYAFESLYEKTGLIAFNMVPDSVHLNDQNSERKIIKIVVDANELSYQTNRVILAKAEGGIAGSTTMISWKAMKEVNGYKVTGVYCPDDAFLITSMNKHNYDMYVAENLYVVHKLVHTRANEEFVQWKTDSLNFALKQTKDVLSEEELLPWALKSEKIFEKMNQNLISS